MMGIGMWEIIIVAAVPLVLVFIGVVVFLIVRGSKK